MLEGYKPLDFSGLFANQPGLSQIRNNVGLSQAAMNILANSGGLNIQSTSVPELSKAGLNEKGEAAPHKQSLLGRAMDALSIPMYAIANAADDSIAGHQSSDTDSVLHDMMETTGGVFTGAGRGIWAGLKGAFGDNAAATDPADKIYLGDALIRLDTHMSAEDAMKPENLEEVRKRLADKKIDIFSDKPEDKYFYNFDKKKVEVSDQDIQDYFKHMQLYGLGASMVGDPMNFIGGGAKLAGMIGKGNKGTAEVFDAAKFPELNSGVGKDPSVAFGKPNGSYKVTLPQGNIQNQLATPEGNLIKPPDWFDFPANPVRNPEAASAPVASKAVASLSDNITPEAWAKALEVSNHGLQGLGKADFLKTEFNLSPKAISDLKEHLFSGTEPDFAAATKLPVATNEIDPIDQLVNGWATGEGTTAKIENDIAGKRPDFHHRDPLIRRAALPKDQAKVAYDYSQPENITKLTGDLLRRITHGGGIPDALQRMEVKFPGIPFRYTKMMIEHSDQIPDFTKRLSTPRGRKEIVGMFNRVIHADAQALSLPQRINSASDIIKMNDATGVGSIGLQRLVENAKLAATPVAASKNPARDAKIVQELVDFYKPQLQLKVTPKWVKDPAKYNASMLKHGSFTGPKQANVWNRLTSKHLVNAKTPGRFRAALNLLKAAEERFIAMGYTPMSATPRAKVSVPLRLSQVLEAIGPEAAAMDKKLLTKILAGDYSTIPAEAAQRIEELKAGEAVVDGDKMISGIDAIKPNLDDTLKGPLSAARTEDIVTLGSKVAADVTRQAGGSPVAAGKAADYVKDLYIPKSPGDGFSTTNGLAMLSNENISSRAYKNFSNASKVAADIVKATGSPPLRKLGTQWGPAARAIEWLGARFNAAYKNPDMRPIYNREASTAKASVSLRAHYLNDLAKRYNFNDADLMNESIKAAQGVQQPLAGSQAEELGQEWLNIMENLFGSSGLKDAAILENSVTGRAQLLMGELNANLRRFGMGQYQFTKKGYAKGIDWMRSWQSWDIKSAPEFMFRIQNVVEHTTREKGMFDEIIGRFAAPRRGGDFQYTVNHPRLQGYYFGKNAADQLQQFTKMLREVSTPNSKTMQNFDKVVSKWKAAVTIYMPSHHIRNIIGDTYFNWLAGVHGMQPYSIALNVMKSQKGRYEGLDDIATITNPNALKQVMTKGGYTAAGKRTALTMQNGTNVTNDMVYVSAFQQGILPSTRVLEDIPDDAVTGLDKFRPLGGKGQKVAHQISEGRDHYIRLAHYVDMLKKSNKPFEAAVEDAAAAVRKWHPDGMDLTKFERNWMRRMFPFYSWSRKAYPLFLESLVATPGKVMAYPKGQYLLQNALGLNPGPMSDPFPTDQLFPDWMREKGIGPLGDGNSFLANPFGTGPDPSGYTVMNPSNPSLDIAADLNHPGKLWLKNLNPVARIPFEVSTGNDVQTGAPIDSTSVDYWAKQTPGVSQLGRATGGFGVSQTTKDNSNMVNWQNIANMLFGAGYQNSGPYQQSAGYDLRDLVKSQRKKKP
jgi:hypothetical protein